MKKTLKALKWIGNFFLVNWKAVSVGAGLALVASVLVRHLYL